MGGKLKLESTEGEGTEFSVVFPLALPGDKTIPLIPLRQVNSLKKKASI
jgi:chemotaxis protein histidine kinase CheA